MTTKRVRVRCKNEPCGWGWDPDRPMMRAEAKATDKVCPRCTCAVELAPGVHVGPREVEPLPGTEADVVRAEAPQARSLFEGLMAPLLELPDVCRVSIRTFRILAMDARVPPHDRAAKVLEEWARSQPSPPGFT